ncbi:hypothetical protein JHK82_012765 [Glycine max]|nr:hypothetical protein JHK82_012765 [Glycine max]
MDIEEAAANQVEAPDLDEDISAVFSPPSLPSSSPHKNGSSNQNFKRFDYIENGIGADQKFIRATNDDKDTALHEAVRYHHIEVVKTLLQMDPDYSYRANNANETTLYLASQRQISKWWLRYQTK